MTNRDYLRNLSNEKLAKLLSGLKLDCVMCDDGNCTRCITKAPTIQATAVFITEIIIIVVFILVMLLNAIQLD